ncbi:MAG TPA: aromatic-ring-hydroxylating dioxygenase subunit beta [Candidatus Binataceae bacterium]|nr:aromatic-ring-hydroxylating dioxygenase subunit beta [Candidatus Binataceae bacterium]
MASLSRQEAEEILFEEAGTLDAGRYNEWFAMLAEDAVYWVPCNGEGVDPGREISLIYDDHARLHDRIERLNSGVAHAQSPPSKTCRLISNVRIEQNSSDTVGVSSAFLLYELRQSRQRIFAGRYRHHLRFENGRWKIALKKAVLVNNDEVIDNLTFIL